MHRRYAYDWRLFMKKKIGLIALLIVAISSLQGCIGGTFDLPLPEYGKYSRAEPERINPESTASITNIEFEVAREGSSYKDISFKTKMKNEFDKKDYYVKFAFEANGVPSDAELTFKGPIKTPPSNNYLFEVDFTYEGELVTNGELYLIIMWLSPSDTYSGQKNTKYLNYNLTSYLANLGLEQACSM